VPLGKLLDWQYLRDHYIDPGTPIEDPILDDPEFRLIFHPSPKQLGVRLRIADGQELPKTGELRNVAVSRVQIAGQSFAQVLTGSVQLFPTIYALIGDVLRRIEAGEKDGVLALANSLRNFEALVARGNGISRDEVVGLYGELLVLESLISAGRADASAWIGANQQCHDFRLSTLELEVKTTTSNTRHHFVHGLNQLNPSPDHELFVVSIRLGAPGSGAGRSLDELVANLSATLSGNEDGTRYFKNELEKTRYEHGKHECTVAYQLAADPTMISIGREFPAMNQDQLAKLLGASAAGRVIRLDLLLNFEGLGVKFVPEKW
jgi:Putative  PD-(D/E)XK family member, (DUF4420)